MTEEPLEEEPLVEPEDDWVAEELPTKKMRRNRDEEDRFDGRIQALLAEAGLLDLDKNMIRFAGSRRFDRRFGPSTNQAVKAFQAREGLAPDGVVGPVTWRRLLGI
jgi:peptidoglycan hydrolase-like protein with peptidoglycan-binding domain